MKFQVICPRALSGAQFAPALPSFYLLDKTGGYCVFIPPCNLNKPTDIFDRFAH